MMKQKNNGSDNIGIVLIDKTILRVDPVIYSSVITYINKGEVVIILNKSKEKERLGNSENYWYNARFSRAYVGWIYGSSIKILSADKTGEIKNLF